MNLGEVEDGAFTVTCVLPDGFVHKDLLTSAMTVAQLKGRITSEVGIPYLCMKLYLDGIELQERRTLGHSGVNGSSQIEVALTRSIYKGPQAGA